MVAGVAAAALAAGLLTACNTKTVSNTPAAATGGSQQAAAGSSGSTPSSAPPAAAKIGDTIDLSGNDKGVKVAVTVVKMVDPARPKDDIMTADPGSRLVAVQIKYQNIGTATFDDAPDNELKLVDGDGQQFEADLAVDTTAGPGFAGGQVTLAPGDSALGFVTFDVPDASKPAKLQVTLDSGFGPKVGVWLLA